MKERTTSLLFFECRKKLNDSHSLNFTGFYNSNSRGKIRQIAEVTELTSETYNSYGDIKTGRKETLE
jgi:hypothetical protein